jgi:hypothetical protein
MSWLHVLRDRYRVATDPLRTERRIELAAVLLLLLLVLQLVYGATRLAIVSAPEAVLPAADSLEVMASLGLETIDDEQSDEIRERPLFWPSRRPVEVVVERPRSKKPKEQELKDVKLVGVFGTGNSVGIIALVEGRIERVRVGEEIDGWKLKTVNQNEAEFRAGSRKAKLSLLPETDKSAGVVNKLSEREQ